MLVDKISEGYVVQVFDTDLKRFVSQRFVAVDQVEYLEHEEARTPHGDPVESSLLEVDGEEMYLPFDMVQPEE